jgi:ElaB/YqjD/DUF883 family membrane-anchored ribosome-binding protein
MNETATAEQGKGEGHTGHHLRESASQIGEQIRDMGSQVRDAAREKYEHLRDRAGHYYDEGRQRARDMEQHLENYVQERPIKSLLIAAGIGLAFGYLLRRSR